MVPAPQWPAVPKVLCYVLAVIQMGVEQTFTVVVVVVAVTVVQRRVDARSPSSNDGERR